MSFTKFLKYLIPVSLFTGLPSLALASGLNPKDAVGISFWIISIAMVAATAFFFLESLRFSGKWRTSMVVGGLVTLVAAVHYFYMRFIKDGYQKKKLFILIYGVVSWQN